VEAAEAAEAVEAVEAVTSPPWLMASPIIRTDHSSEYITCMSTVRYEYSTVCVQYISPYITSTRSHSSVPR
jgi:hypothetical protein